MSLQAFPPRDKSTAKTTHKLDSDDSGRGCVLAVLLAHWRPIFLSVLLYRTPAGVTGRYKLLATALAGILTQVRDAMPSL